MIRKIRLILVILLVSLNVASQTRSDKLLNNLHDKNSKYIFVIAHRGDWRNAPENSIQCIENAIEMGVDMVEIDIQPTKDRNFICMHDETLATHFDRRRGDKRLYYGRTQKASFAKW